MIEVRIRVLMKSDKGDVASSATLVSKEPSASLDVAKVVADLKADLDTPPLGNLRPMTEEEADAYREQERLDEESDGYTDLGLSDADLEEPAR